MTAAVGFPMPKVLVVDEATASATYAKFITDIINLIGNLLYC